MQTYNLSAYLFAVVPLGLQRAIAITGFTVMIVATFWLMKTHNCTRNWAAISQCVTTAQIVYPSWYHNNHRDYSGWIHADLEVWGKAELAVFGAILKYAWQLVYIISCQQQRSNYLVAVFPNLLWKSNCWNHHLDNHHYTEIYKTCWMFSRT